MAAVCWSQQSQSPTWNLEPRQPGGGGATGLNLTAGTLVSQPAKINQSCVCLCIEFHPVGDLHVSSFLIYPKPVLLNPLLFALFYFQLLLFFKTLKATPNHLHLKSLHSCLISSKRGWSWCEAKTTHYVMYLLIQGSCGVTRRVELGVKGQGLGSK